MIKKVASSSVYALQHNDWNLARSLLLIFGKPWHDFYHLSV